MKTGNTAGKINLLLTEQFAIDYGCTVEDFCSKETLVTELRPNDRARKREELGVLSMLSFHGKLVIAAAPEATARPATPPSSAAMRFSKTSCVELVSLP